ncbi:lipopolysaccharide biosynthesis protein RfbH [Candidatus Wolfebacteria bacterium RIFOXYD12_FULL_48_21]|uniref:Lipopolysaccharide biosynthesis protein RfbH n=1 Tax=Candidatus Wolfebacteria bacterium RIFOXYD1_FULL_48_65 TaxID=1802561 RepID=A0A1F8DZB7_9BACT|nr:MAG: lipopolysaccharide biosynthesis protein RfbH [Candidatus Wolfebacteria bacterium RIFOXYD1_FULL_48_65]OGM94307.1 MAG: lipopolysaccharide biosynthesis protein RfbH [Candidatus Wolfebacteria bacterium RIFOXYD12_FULL_48_21]
MAQDRERIISFVKKYLKDRPQPGPFIPGQTPVPVSGKVVSGLDMQYMIEAVLDGHWTEGRFAEEFEERLASFIRVRYCSIVNSGSSANLLALTALTSFRIPEDRRLKKGDEVITVAAGFPTTINPIIQNGLRPVFVDIEPGTYNASIDSIMEAVSSRTRAVFLAHTLGNPFEAQTLRTLCDELGLWLVEDNCDALGTKHRSVHTGAFGHLSTCSFYPAHHITMGEGGAVLTDDPLLHKIVRSLRDWGRDCSCATGADNACGKRFTQQHGDLPYGYDHKYVYSELGYNMKVTDMQAALGLAQLERLPTFIRRRRENFSFLHMFFRELYDSFILPEWSMHSQPSWFGYPLTIRDTAGFTRGELLKFLEQKKIGTRLLFAGNVTNQPYFKNYDFRWRSVGKAEGNRIVLPNTDIVMDRMFWIGVYPGLNIEMINYVTKSFKEFLASR